jgi:hypothetical protein
MSDKAQDQPLTDWEGEGGAVEQEPKQKTAEGYEIPVPKRESIFVAFKKIIQPVKKP